MAKDVADNIQKMIDQTVEHGLAGHPSDILARETLISLNTTVIIEETKGIVGHIFTYDPGITNGEADELRKKIATSYERLKV